ncbi:MAG: sugar ABC transporter permease [Acutalibacteraceae bacterium]|nr:sugar ABC transporter permease [Acutalibacteraceae bacterium]
MEKTVKRWFPVFVLPTLAAFLIAFVIPFVMGVALSFTEFRTVSDTDFVGFSNYVRAFTDDNLFLQSLWFTVKFAVISVIGINVIAFVLALLFTRELPATNFFRTIFFMPNLIGGIVLGYIWQVIINGVLYKFGYSITSNPTYGFWGLVILMHWQMVGYMMIIYIAGIQNIPTDILEAARVDGANAATVLFKITIPSVMPSITICLFLTITNSFKLFDQNLALTAGAPANRTQMVALDIYNTFYSRSGYEGVGQAKAVIFFIIVAVIALLQLYLTRRKEVES